METKFIIKDTRDTKYFLAPCEGRTSFVLEAYAYTIEELKSLDFFHTYRSALLRGTIVILPVTK